jgi:hypothetical protein
METLLVVSGNTVVRKYGWMVNLAIKCRMLKKMTLR